MALIKDDDKKYLLSLKPEDITFELLLELFGDKVQKDKNGKINVKKSRFNTYDTFILEKGDYFNNEKITTTVGRFIYNKLIVERELVDVLGYINEPINSGTLSSIEDKISKALLNDKITVDVVVNYLNRTQWLAMQFHSVISGSFTMGTLKPNKKVIERRNQLLNENREKLKKGDVISAAKIEKELLDIAQKELEGDHGLDLYKSGARGSFGNNYKNISVMKGPVYNPTTDEFEIVESNFMEGIRKEEIPIYGNAIITGAYPKAIGTATSGYFSKQIIAALQAVQLDEKGSDCGTKGLSTITINKNQAKDYLYRYILENGKLVLLDDNNIEKYIGKTVKMRSPMFCVGEKLCRTCAGLMYEKLGIKNIGLTASRVSSTLLNLSMKKFHDTSTRLSQIKTNEVTI